MKFCSDCGSVIEKRIPDGDNLERDCCTKCDSIFYFNPKIIVGTVPVKNNNYGSPKLFTDNSCIISTLDNLENSIKKILNDKKRYSEITEIGSNSALSYLSNQGNASDALLSFLSGNKNSR